MLDWAYVVMIIVWGTYYSIRLIDHSRNKVFLKQPWLLLWLTGYVFGFSYILNNYSVQAHLEANLFPFTEFPIVILIKLSLFTLVYMVFFTGIRYYSAYHLPQYVEPIILICYIISSGFVVILFSQSATYPTLYWTSNILMGMTAFVALLLLLPVVRKFVRADFATVEQIHLIWYGLCMCFAGIGVLFNSVSAIDGLISNRDHIADVNQHIAYLANTLSLVAMMILTSPDQFIFLTGFPLQRRKLQRLGQLQRYILGSLTIEENYPLSNDYSLRDIERAIYEHVVSIIDLYPYLYPESDLYKTLADIEYRAKSYHDCLELLSHVSIPEST